MTKDSILFISWNVGHTSNRQSWTGTLNRRILNNDKKETQKSSSHTWDIKFIVLEIDEQVSRIPFQSNWFFELNFLFDQKSTIELFIQQIILYWSCESKDAKFSPAVVMIVWRN